MASLLSCSIRRLGSSTLASSVVRPQVCRTLTMTPVSHNSATDTVEAPAAATTASSAGRWTYTAEIMVSKIFPAGFGWQFSSGIAEGAGMGADSMGFALTTGIGDATGVMIGHTAYKVIQSFVSDKVSVAAEIKTATWLATGALFAGTSWQPLVNLFHDSMGLGFAPTFGLVAAGCGTAFFGGLQVGRVVFPFMPSANSTTVMQDAGLSLSIGGATGMFVATDLSFTAAQSDVLYQITSPAFGIGDSTSVLEGCVKAGSSTLTGFGIFNAAQNALPAGANWMDGNNPYTE